MKNMDRCLSRVDASFPFPLRLIIWVGTGAVWCFLSVSVFGGPDIEAAALVVSPPRVERLVAQRSFADGTKAFILLKYDSGNAFVKMSKTRSALDKRLLARGDTVSGRVGNQVWVGDEGVGSDLWVADIDAPVTANPAVLQHQRTTLLLADHHSRLGRSLLTFGIDIPISADVLTTNGTIIYEDGGFNVIASVEVKSPTSAGAIPFSSRWRKVTTVTPGADSDHPESVSGELYECNGEMSSQTKLPLWFELVQIDGAGRRHKLGRAEILDVEFAREALTIDAFSIPANVDGGARSLIVQTNDAILQQDLFSGARSERKVSVFGHLISTRTIRYCVLILIVAVSVVFAAMVMFKTRRQSPNHG
jgi:hypothetical protein